MNDQSQQALANAISLEIKKDGLVQRQSGDWQLRFTVAGIDMDARIASAPMGTRFQCVLVEINDDETPVDHRAMERDKWKDLGATKQAGIRCKEPIFWGYLRERHDPDCRSEERAAVIVREICGIVSRTDLQKPNRSDARELWHHLDFDFQAWKAKENA